MKLKNTKGVSRNRKSKDRQYNNKKEKGQKDKQWSEKSIDWDWDTPDMHCDNWLRLAVPAHVVTSI